MSCGQKQPARDVPVTVIAITGRLSRFHGDEVVVTVRSSAGLVARQSVVVSNLACRVGDTAVGTIRGVSLALKKGQCRRIPYLA